MNSLDYRKFYDDETYLLDEVSPHFRNTGELEAPDFYMLLSWKANRAKNYHRDRMKDKAGSFQGAVSAIASELHSNTGCKQKLQVLMSKWGFYIPTATAILTILYPDDFTVYDKNVCKEVQCPYTPWREFSDHLWTQYETFKAAVIQNTPANFSLRDKDRFLTGRFLRREAELDCAK
jgi:hypothetical protein